MDLPLPTDTTLISVDAVTDGTHQFVLVDLAPNTPAAAAELLKLVHVDRRDVDEHRVSVGGPVKDRADGLELNLAAAKPSPVADVLEAAGLQTAYGF